MITLEQMFAGKMNHPDATPKRKANAEELLIRVEDLLWFLEIVPPVCPNTGTQISGSLHGDGDGGFRLQSSKTGAPNSSHKEGQAVDIYDPKAELDAALTDHILQTYNLYREAPDSTPGWCHLTTRAPKSGKRTFNP